MASTDDIAFLVEQPVDVQLRTMQQEAFGALLSKDYGTARNRASAALLIVATIPDGMIQGTASQTWDRPGIALFLEQLDKLEASEATSDSGGMVLQSYSYSGRRSC